MPESGSVIRFRLTAGVLALVSLLAAACQAETPAEPPTGSAVEQAKPPNIILIMVDDMGYSDPGFIGGDIETPHIDRLAREGVVFEQFYNNAKCSQTRASLLSGLYYQQAHKAGPSGNLGHDQLAQDNHTTLADVLKSAGYATAMTGKWHLSGTPYESGFEQFYGFLEGSQSHWDTDKVFGTYLRDSGPFYSSDDFTSAGIQFLEHGVAEDKPVFLYLAYTAPHYPLHAHEEDIARYKGRFAGGWAAVRERRIQHMKESGQIPGSFTVGERLQEAQEWDQQQNGWVWADLTAAEQADQERLMEVYAAMLQRLDWNIGRLLSRLESMGLARDTVVFFLSDNGGSPYSKQDIPGTAAGPPGSFRTLNTAWAEVNSAPFRLFKRYSHEGGIATPMIAYWPGHIAAPGRRNKEAFHVIDFMPSLIELAETEYPGSRYGEAVLPTPGVSFVPVLNDQPVAPERQLFWEYQENYAMREGQWKLVQSNLDPRWALYDLESDRGEVNDLSGQHPERFERMKTQWQAWHEAVTTHQAVVH